MTHAGNMRVDLGALELLVVNDVTTLDSKRKGREARRKNSAILEYVGSKEAFEQHVEQLQEYVYTQLNVFSPRDRVVRYGDMVMDGDGDISALDGEYPFYLLLLRDKSGKLLGMRSTEQVEEGKISSVDGTVVIDYVPPLVRAEDAGKEYDIRNASLNRLTPGRQTMTPVQILDSVTRHLKKPHGVAMRITEGIGTPRGALLSQDYKECAVTFPIHSFAGEETRATYEHLIDETHIFIRFTGASTPELTIPDAGPGLTERQAEQIIMKRLIGQGYVNYADNYKQLKKDTGFTSKTVPCMAEGRLRLKREVREHGYVRFLPIVPNS
jgi:hypothetical protein